MKKFLIIILIFISTILTGCAKSNKTSINIFGGKLKLEDTRRCENVSIKYMDSDYQSQATFYITPSGFNFEELNKKGYRMKIVITYEVYYKKDYDVLWDIGYAGAPKYETYVLNDQDYGVVEEDLSTTKTSIKRSIEYTTEIINLQNTKLRLIFSTDNIQNIIYISNINVSYKCYK